MIEGHTIVQSQSIDFVNCSVFAESFVIKQYNFLFYFSFIAVKIGEGKSC